MADKLPLKIYTAKEVAETLRMSVRTLHDFTIRHPYYIRNGKRKLFTEDDVARLVAAMRENNTRYVSEPVLIRHTSVVPNFSHDPYASLRDPKKNLRNKYADLLEPKKPRGRK